MARKALEKDRKRKREDESKHEGAAAAPAEKEAKQEEAAPVEKDKVRPPRNANSWWGDFLPALTVWCLQEMKKEEKKDEKKEEKKEPKKKYITDNVLLAAFR